MGKREEEYRAVREAVLELGSQLAQAVSGDIRAVLRSPSKRIGASRSKYIQECETLLRSIGELETRAAQLGLGVTGGKLNAAKLYVTLECVSVCAKVDEEDAAHRAARAPGGKTPRVHIKGEPKPGKGK